MRKQIFDSECGPWLRKSSALTWHVVLRRRQHGCASWGLLLLRTPSQNTHALWSESRRTGWQGTGAERCSPSQRSFSRTSSCMKKKRHRTSGSPLITNIHHSLKNNTRLSRTCLLHHEPQCLLSLGLWWRTSLLWCCTRLIKPAEWDTVEWGRHRKLLKACLKKIRKRRGDVGKCMNFRQRNLGCIEVW